MEMLNEKVLLIPSTRKTMKNGIFLPDNLDKMTIGVFADIGEIVSVGKLSPINIKKGQKVIFDKTLGYEFVFENKKFFMASSYDILAIIEE